MRHQDNYGIEQDGAKASLSYLEGDSVIQLYHSFGFSGEKLKKQAIKST